MPTKMHSATFFVGAVAKGRPRVTSRGTYTPERTRKATQELQALMASDRPRPMFLAAIQLRITFWLPIPAIARRTHRPYPIGRPDVDNYAKLVMDAGNGIWWEDDSQIVCLIAEKYYAADPRIQLWAGELDC